MATNFSRLQEVVGTLRDLRAILVEENESNWLRGVEAMHVVAETALASSLDEEHVVALQQIGRTYRSMLAGMGSFSDFIIWREDFHERVRLNDELKAVMDRLWRALNRPGL